MKRLIRRPWFAVTTFMAAVILAGSSLSLSFGQPPTTSTLVVPSAEDGLKRSLTGRSSASDQVLADTDAEIGTVIEAYRQHDGQDEKAQIAKALSDIVGKQFDARQLVREGELKQLEQQLHKLQELHQRRAKQRDQIIEERVRQLLRDADGLGWGSDDESQPSAGSAYGSKSDDYKKRYPLGR